MQLHKLKRFRVKITASFVVLFVIIMLASSCIHFIRNTNLLIKNIRLKVENIAAGMSLLLDVEGHKKVTLEREPESIEYQNIIAALREYQDLAGVEYVYTLVKTSEDATEFIVDTDIEEPAEIGEPYEMLEGMLAAFAGDVSSDASITTDEWGSFISGYAPLKDSTGAVNRYCRCRYICGDYSRRTESLIL